MQPKKPINSRVTILSQEAAVSGLPPPVKLMMDATSKIVEVFQGMKSNKAELELVNDVVASMETFYTLCKNVSDRAEWLPHGFQLLQDGLTSYVTSLNDYTTEDPVNSLVSVLDEIETFILEQVNRSWVARLLTSTADSTKINLFRQKLQAIVTKLECLDHVTECIQSTLQPSRPIQVPSPLENVHPGDVSREAVDSSFPQAALLTHDNMPKPLLSYTTSPTRDTASHYNSHSGAYADGHHECSLSPSHAFLPYQLIPLFSIQHQGQTPTTVPFQPPYYQNSAPMIAIARPSNLPTANLPALSLLIPSLYAQSPLEPADSIPQLPPITINTHISNVGNSNNSTHVE